MRRPVVHCVELPGWSVRSGWGYDPRLESLWCELWRPGEADPTVRVGPEQLVASVPALARVVARRVGLEEDVVFVALTASGPRRAAVPDAA